MYTEIANNDYYELGIVGDLVCLQFKPAFDQVLGEDRGKGELRFFGDVKIWSESIPKLEFSYANGIWLPGNSRGSDDRFLKTVCYYRRDPAHLATRINEALQEYIASKQPFKRGDKYWTFWFNDGALSSYDLLWANDSIDRRRLALGITFKTKEECEKCIEETKEFWRSR